VNTNITDGKICYILFGLLDLDDWEKFLAGGAIQVCLK